eukprot:TRINITY_DN736_c0_g2_i1.p1 TRINITY_DN736_c0_g2~~TRINITY_DN736_c0_g2_i1.p1  ORF type:complete len:346 (-),score=79.68 TRINITY_DN736_c0_g2_i1:3-1040(-)
MEVPRQFFRVDSSAQILSGTTDGKIEGEAARSDLSRSDPAPDQTTLSSGKKTTRRTRSSRVSPGKKKKSQSPGFSEDQLAALLGRALEQQVSKSDFVFKSQTFRAFHRCTLTLPMLENLEFQGAAQSSDGARETAMLLAACHAVRIIDSPSGNPKLKLAHLVQYALGTTLPNNGIVYMNQKLGDMTESTLTLPMLTEMELGEFRATAETAKGAEELAALVAIQELEARLTAMGNARKAKKYDTPPSSDAVPKQRLRHLLRHALGMRTSNDDIIYEHQELGETIEVTVTLPVLSDVEPREFKATMQLAEGLEQAQNAAALLAFQELEPSLMAREEARMAHNCDREE